MMRVRPLGVSVLYLACMAGFVYGIAEQQVGYGSDVTNVVVLGGLVVLQVATGWGAAHWWAVPLPAVAVLIALPAGYPDDLRGEPLPIWFGLAVFAPIGALLIATGVGAARLLRQSRDRRRKTRG